MTSDERNPREPGEPGGAPRVLVLYGPASYRHGAFLGAAARLGLETVQGIDLPDPLATHWGVPVSLEFSRPDDAVERIAAIHAANPLDAILPVDDAGTLLAARAADRLGLAHNDPESALAARDKWVMRERFAAGGVPVPVFRRYPLDANPDQVAAEVGREIGWPCVVKPPRLSGSRGVIRADDPAQFAAAWERTRRIVVEEGADSEAAFLLVEEYLPGVEVAVEGLLTNGALQVLAIFDKPDPLEGPFFEETIYVTPSRLPDEVQQAIAAGTAEAAAAVGLRQGPVHAELRINERGVWPIELAGRSIGGLCSSVLEHTLGAALEEVILRHAVGMPLPMADHAGSGDAVGVMMIPIPGAGMLRGWSGQDAACAVSGITGLEITAKVNNQVVPLPEGAAYLGFIFARGESPEQVEAALREAHAHLHFDIAPMLALRMIGG
jgi:biotin carboxylase